MSEVTRTTTCNASYLSVSKALGVLLSFAFAVGALSGCFENSKGIVLTPKIPVTPSTNSVSYAFTLSKVLLNSSDPAGTFDLHGDGSGAISKYCKPDSATNPTTTSCYCVYNFQYTDPSSGVTSSQQVTVDTTYAELNSVRCPYGTLPPAVSSVGVSLATKDNSSKSNTLTFSFGTSNSVMDTSKDYNFSRIYRFTCRPKVYAANALDPASGIYDPDLSEGDPGTSYPVSFYTSNFGASLLAFASSGKNSSDIWDYDCPPDPRHPSKEYWETIYSTTPSPDGSLIISGDPGPKAAPKNVNMNEDNPRSTFYLSKLRTGIFTINVNAYIAPHIISQPSTTPNAQGGGLPSLGWGASPRSTGVGTETCPSSTVGDPNYVTIPTGYHWVKVWLFRMTFDPRKFLYGYNLQRLGAIGCNPGNWTSPPGGTPAPYTSKAPDCFGMSSLASGDAARFAQGLGGICFNIHTWASGHQDPEYSCGKPKQVSWANEADSTNNPGGLGVCKADPASPAPPAAPLPNLPTDKAPTDKNPQVANLDSPSATNYEFLFVVTPNSVNSGDMSNSASSVYAQYAPFRFRAHSDCGNNDLSGPGCQSTYMFRNYGLKLHDVADSGEPPQSNPNLAGIFPLCALQPDGI